MLSSTSKLTAMAMLSLLCGGVLAPACSSGGDDDDASAGSSNGGTAGSSNGTAGSSAGGSNGGNAGNGGTSGAGQVISECPGVMPAEAVVADFDVPPEAGEMYEWGSVDQGEMDFWGGTFSYPAALETTFEDGAMTVAGNVAEYAGFGLYVQNCADASSYAGVRFKIKGNPPMGKMSFAVQTNANEWATGTKGSCRAPEAQRFVNCVHPSVPITVTDAFTTVEVRWADLGGGKPAAAAKTDGSDVIGLQFILPWAEKATPYDTSVTIDDVELIAPGAGGDGAGGAGAGGEPAMGGAGGAK